MFENPTSLRMSCSGEKSMSIAKALRPSSGRWGGVPLVERRSDTLIGNWKSLLNLTTWKCICLLVSKSLELLKNKLKRQKVSLHSYEDKQRAKHDTWCSPYSNVAPVLSEQINNSLLHFGTKTSNRNFKQWSIHSPRVMEQTPANNSKWSVGWFHDSRDELKTKQHKVSRTYREIFQYIYIIYI